MGAGMRAHTYSINRMFGIITTAVVALGLLVAAAVASDHNTCLSCTDCAKCTGLTVIAGETQVLQSAKFRVTISVADCKNGAGISWLCCRSSASSGIVGNTPFNNGTCDLVAGCDFPSTQEDDKCNNVTQSLVFDVPFGATNITVQLHDGQFAGNFDCGGPGNPNCCGGSGGSCGDGVCLTTIDLSTCPLPCDTLTLPSSLFCDTGAVGDAACIDAYGTWTTGCGADGKCTTRSVADTLTTVESKGNPCVSNLTGLNKNFCQAFAELASCNNVCVVGTVDFVYSVQEFGDIYSCVPGHTYACDCTAPPPPPPPPCPGGCAYLDSTCGVGVCSASGVCEQRPRNVSSECRASAGPCDIAEHCSPQSAVCPHDVFRANTTGCRASEGPCDAEEKCTGSSATCPHDAKIPNGFECLAKDGVCDRADVCDGVNDECVDTVYLREDNVICRRRDVAGDGTSCDVDDYCDGSGKQCPLQNNVETQGTPCRPAADHCDVAEVCNGKSASCPANVRNDFAYTYKCSTTQYLCGVTQQELTGNKGRQNYLGQCGIGSASTFVDLKWPECLDECIQAKCPCIEAQCPKQRGLSNFAEAVCNPSDGTWTCVNKVDVTSSTQLPYCPHDPTPTVLTMHGLVKTLETPAATDTDNSPTPIQIAIVVLAGVAVLILLVLLLWKVAEASGDGSGVNMAATRSATSARQPGWSKTQRL